MAAIHCRLDDQAVAELRCLIRFERAAGKHLKGLPEAFPGPSIGLRDIIAGRNHDDDPLHRSLPPFYRKTGERRRDHACPRGRLASSDGQDIAATDDIRVPKIKVGDPSQQLLIAANPVPRWRRDVTFYTYFLILALSVH